MEVGVVATWADGEAMVAGGTTVTCGGDVGEPNGDNGGHSHVWRLAMAASTTL